MFRPVQGRDGAIAPSVTSRESRILRTLTRADVAFEVFAQSDLTRWMNPTVELARGGRLRTTTVSHDYFTVLGVAMTGSGFQAEDDQSDRRLAIVSYRFASTHFAPGISALGQTIATQKGAVTIVGIAPKEFVGTRLGEYTDLWIPFGAIPTFGMPKDSLDFIPVAPVIRLHPSASWQAVQAELEQLTDGRALVFSLARLPFVPASLGAMARQRQLFYALVLMAGLVLMATVLNLSGLLATRMDSRRPEIAVRLALGSSKLNVVKVFVRDAVELACGGVVVGLSIAYGVTHSVRHLTLPAGVALSDLDLSVDWRIVVFGVVLAIVVVCIAAVVPLTRAVATQPRDLLARSALDGDRGVSRTRFTLLAAYVALSVVLNTATASLATRVSRLYSGDQGLDGHSLIVASVTPEAGTYMAVSNESAARVVTDFRAAIDAAQSLAGVELATYGDVPLPISGVVPKLRLTTEGASLTHPVVLVKGGPGYLHAIGGTLVSGRDLRTDDLGPPFLNIVPGPPTKSAHRPGVLIDKTLGDLLWPRSNASGSVLQIDDLQVVVVGVIRNVLPDLPSRIRASTVVIASQPSGWLGSRLPSILVRRTAAMPSIQELDQHLRAAFLAGSEVRTRPFAQRLTEVLANEQLGMRLFGWLGIVATVLGTIGIYGLAALHTLGRRREMAIRAALGATRRRLRWICVARVVGAILLGTGIGCLVAMGFSWTAQASIVGLGEIATSSYALASIVVLLAGAAAAMAGTKGLQKLNIHQTLNGSS